MSYIKATTNNDGSRIYQGEVEVDGMKVELKGPSVTTVLSHPGSRKKYPKGGNHALRGTECHWLIESYFEGFQVNPEGLETDSWDYFQALRPHLSELTKEATELSVLVKSRFGSFGGTVDFVGYLGESRVVVDWKTTSSSPGSDRLRSWGYQLAAYSHAIGGIDGAYIYAVIKSPRNGKGIKVRRWYYDPQTLAEYWRFFEYRLGVWHKNNTKIK